MNSYLCVHQVTSSCSFLGRSKRSLIRIHQLWEHPGKNYNTKLVGSHRLEDPYYSDILTSSMWGPSIWTTWLDWLVPVEGEWVIIFFLEYDECFVVAQNLGVTGKLSSFFILIFLLKCDLWKISTFDNVIDLWVSSLHTMEVSHHMTSFS